MNSSISLEEKVDSTLIKGIYQLLFSITSDHGPYGVFSDTQQNYLYFDNRESLELWIGLTKLNLVNVFGNWDVLRDWEPIIRIPGGAAGDKKDCKKKRLKVFNDDESEEIMPRYSERGINYLPVGKTVLDKELDILARFYKEFQMKAEEGDVIVTKRSCFRRVMTSSNPHECYARLRILAMESLVYDIAYSSGFDVTVDKNGNSINLDKQVWSVAANIKRMAPYFRVIHSNNPLITNADKDRIAKNAMYLKEKSDKGTMTDEKCTMSGILESVEKLGKLEKVVGHYTIDENKVIDVLGDGACLYRSAAIVMYGNDNVENLTHIFKHIGNVVVAEHKINANQEYTGADLAVMLEKQPEQITTLNYVWGDATDQWFLDLKIAVYDYDGRSWTHVLGGDSIKKQCVIRRNEHFEVYNDAKLSFVQPIQRTDLIGIHCDVHYYTEVMETICNYSLAFPQFLQGWTFTASEGIYRDSNLTVEISSSGIRMDVEGNQSNNGYIHPNFVFEKADDVREYTDLRGRVFIIRTIRKTSIGNFATYRTMMVEPKIISEVILPKIEDECPFDYFKTIFNQHDIETSGCTIRIRKDWTYCYEGGLNDATGEEICRKASTSKVIFAFRHCLKEMSTMKILNITARAIDNAKENELNEVLHASFIAQKLAALYVLEIADVRNLETLHNDANNAIKDYRRGALSGVRSFLKFLLLKQAIRDKAQLEVKRNESIFDYLKRTAITIIGSSIGYISSAVCGYMGMCDMIKRVERAYNGLRQVMDLIIESENNPNFRYNKFNVFFEFITRLHENRIIGTALFWVGLSYCCYKMAPYIRAIINKPTTVVRHRNKAIKMSSSCPGGLRQGGYISKKAREMIEAGFEINDNLKILKWPKEIPRDILNGGKEAVTLFKKHLICDKEADHAIMTKGPNFGLYPLKYHKCRSTLYFSLLRIFNPVPKPDPEIIDRYGDWYQNTQIPWIDKRINVLKEKPEYADWLANVKPYVRGFIDRVTRDGNSENSKVGFVIDVKIDELMPTIEDEPRPRPIQQARNIDKLNYRGIWYITKIISDIDYAYRCGANWDEDAKVLSVVWSGVLNGVGIPGDLSSNDATQSILEREKTDLILFSNLLKRLGDDWVDDQKATLENVTGRSKQTAGFFEYGDFRATMIGKQNTGASDTTAGNTERNRRRMRFLLSGILNLKEVELGKDGEEWILIASGDYGLLVLGDDFLLVVNKAHVKLVEDNMHHIYCKGRYEIGGLGHWYKDTLSMDWPEFCSRDLIDRGDGSFRWIRKIKRFMQLTPFTISVRDSSRNDIVEYELRKMAYMEGIGMLKWARNLPIYHKYAQTLIRLGQEVPYEEIEEKYLKRWEMRAIGEVTDVREEDRGLVIQYWENRYGLSREVVTLVEDALDKCTSLHDQIDCPEIIELFKENEGYEW